MVLVLSGAVCVRQCAPPGLVFGQAGELRAQNRVMVLKVSCKLAVSSGHVTAAVRLSVPERILQVSSLLWHGHRTLAQGLLWVC